MITLTELTDIERLMRWRAEVIERVFGQTPSAELMEANRRYYVYAIPARRNIAFVATLDGEECGCGGVCLSEELPSPDNPSGRCGYLMNIYVRESFRGRGIAHRIVERLVSEAKTCGCGKIYLETTAIGKPVYESLGFRDMPDMMKLL